MIETSAKFKDDMKASTRKIHARVQIDYSDPEIDQGIDITTNDSNHTSYPFQIANGKDIPTFKYASLDGNWTLGDDTFSLAPSLEEAKSKNIQMGLWGEKLSDSNGNFSTPYPTIEIGFISRPIRSLKLVGDSKLEEYPVDFIVSLYNEFNEAVYTENIVGNNEVHWEKDIEQINEVIKMEIIITKWNKANRVIKILEVITSVQEIYEGDDIMFIHLLEEKEVSQGSLPIGNISSNEIQIKLNNIDRQFDAGNINSDLYGLVKPNRIIRAWVGTEDHLVPLGIFWSKDWDVPESDIIATVIGRDRLDRLNDTEYTSSTVQINKTMYQLAEMVLIDGGLQSHQYWLDDELKGTIIPYAYFNPASHREVLRQIATASLGQVYCDRSGVIRFEGPSFVFGRATAKEVSMLLQSNFPAEMNMIDAYGVSQEDYFTKDNPSRQTDIANHITVETQPLKPSTEREIYASNEPLNIAAGDTRSISIFFNESPAIDVSINITGTGTITETNVYSWGANVKVFSSVAGSFNITAIGKPLEVTNKDKVTVQDRDSIIDNGTIRYDFPSNHLIQSVSIAQTIADKLLQYYKDPKRDLSMDWRGNPSLELNDIVMVDDYIRGADATLGYYYITKQEIEYNGGLRAKLDGRRAL